MEFGRLENIEGLDFTMPPDPAATVKLLKNLSPKVSAPEVFSGCTGWSMKEWVGSYYPNGTKVQDFLQAYSRQFNTIELNSTYYKIPDKKTVKKWVDQTEKDFKFAPKIPLLISQHAELALDSTLIGTFAEVILEFGNKLGTSFLQLPPSFGPAKLRILEQFLERFPVKEVPLSVEIRHENWFVQRDMENLQEMLSAYGAGTVFTDVAGRRDVLHMYLSNSTAMIRFVGNELHPSDYSRLDAWVDRLKLWFDQGLQKLYFFHHQHDNLLAPEMAAYFNKKLNEKIGLNLNIPVKHVDQQLTLF